MLTRAFRIFQLLLLGGICSLAWSSNVFAESASLESIKRLFVVSKVKGMIEQSHAQAGQQMMIAVNNRLAQVQASEEAKQRALDVMNRVVPKMVENMKQQMSWAKLEPEYTKIYQEAFTEEEVQGMLDFYATPAGQAVLNKMPVLMQKAMAMTQRLILPFLQEMDQAIENEVEKCKNEHQASSLTIDS